MDSVSWVPFVWIIAGIVLILLEFVIPGLIVIFFGVGALVTGLAMFMGMPDSHGLPFIVFAVVSLGSLLLLRRQFASVFKGGSVGGGGVDDDLIGKTAVVLSWESGSSGCGKIEFRGTSWNALGDESFKAGEHVRIVGREGLALKVERAAPRIR